MFYQSEIEYLGYKFSAEGISPSPTKVDNVVNMPLPETTDQLRSFLGLVTFVGCRFVPHFSTLTSVLFDMCSQGSPRKLFWSDDAKSAFENLKQAVVQSFTLTWFDPSCPIKIQSDASGAGIGSCLIQNDKVVAFASRKLSEVESRYSTLEKEYAKKFRGRNVHYQVGDLVYFRKGQGGNYSSERSILEVLPNHAYRIDTYEGYSRIYNQSNLKRRFSSSNIQSEAEAHLAYDMAINQKDHEIKTLPSCRKLRSKRVDPSVYKE